MMMAQVKIANRAIIHGFNLFKKKIKSLYEVILALI